MDKDSLKVYLSIAFVVVIALSYWVGMNDGRIKTCDSLRPAFLDDSRMKAVTNNEMGAQYLKDISSECSW